MAKLRKPYDQMSAAELAQATKEYDAEMVNPPGRPASPAERRKFKAVMGRPVIGKGSKMVPISFERGLLKEADSFAKRHKLKRSKLVAEALRMFMSVKSDGPAPLRQKSA